MADTTRTGLPSIYFNEEETWWVVIISSQVSIIDALVCARENGATTAYIPQHNIEWYYNLINFLFQQCNTDMHDI